MELVLASASPRRVELLKMAGYDFSVMPSDADENLPDEVSPEEGALLLAERKALDVAQKCRGAVVVGADTIVVNGDKVLGKPKDKSEAVAMLNMLSGQRHKVYTGVCVVKEGKAKSFCCCTEVEFYSLTESEILDYVNSGEPMDKAGAYGIQGKGALFIKGIVGDYFNVVGLPVARLHRVLKEAGICNKVGK